MIDKNKVVFIGLTEMKYYNGEEVNNSGSGIYVEEHDYGYELFNFKNDNDKCYGYTAPYGKVNLSIISSDINSDKFGKYIDNVLVIFTGTRKSKGRVVVGFYINARVYENLLNDNRQSRYFCRINKYVPYNIVCDSVNAILIDYNNRTKVLPSARSNNGIGHGRHNLWYANGEKNIQLKQDMLNYVNTILNSRYNSDEYKYHFPENLYDESKKRLTTTTQIERSSKARAECIQLKGSYCNICGFDFLKTYGKSGEGYIEVHHITPIGELSSAEGYEGTNPKIDLIPLCSNCHSMIHRHKPPYTPDELRKMLN